MFFAPGEGHVWSPAIVGAARVTYADSKGGIDESRVVIVWTPILDGPVPVDWERAEPADFRLAELTRDAPVDRPFEPVLAAATTPKKYTQWARDFTQWITRSQTVELLKSPQAKLVSRPDESERDFRVRLQTTLRERRDAEMVKIRERYAAKLATHEDRVRRAQSDVERQQQQASESKLQAGVSVAATIVGAMLGRRAVSAGTLGRATTAARGMGRIGRESQDVGRAQEGLSVAIAKRDEVARALDADLHAIATRWDQARDESLERVLLKPKRGGVSVQLVALVWMPR